MQITTNLTQHNVTESQERAGICDLVPGQHSKLKALLTMKAEDVNQASIIERAEQIADFCEYFAVDGQRFMIGGAPFLMPVLSKALWNRGYKPFYAVSDRVSEESTLADGSVRKVVVFNHVSLVEAM